METNQETIQKFKEETIEIEEYTFNIAVKQEINEEMYKENVANDLIINSIRPVKQEVNEDLNSDLIIERCVSIKRENNANNTHVGNELKYLKERKMRRTKFLGQLINGRKMKNQDTINGIIVCVICGNLYTKEVEYFYHHSIHHSLRIKKLCKTQFNKRDINSFKTAVFNNLGEKVNNELEQETKKCARLNVGGTFKPQINVCNSGETPVQCNICLKYFSQRRNLRIHLRIHTGEKPFNCEICLKSFSRKCILKTHRASHTGEKPFKCNVCLKSFSQRGNLTTHSRCHSAEKKPFQCEMCLKSFSRKGNLNIHLRSHTGEKPFKCDFCLKSFLQKVDLNKHFRCHTGEKPFKCDICLKSFSQKGNLKIHLQIHMGKKPVQR